MTETRAEPAAGQERPALIEHTHVALLAAVAVFTFCLIGIFTRPSGLLAAFWPANAVLLGILLRSPKRASWSVWCAAAVAYLCADLLTGSTLLKSILLNGTNLASVAIAYGLFMRFSTSHLGLDQPWSIIHLLINTSAAALVAGILGAVLNPLLFDGSSWSGFLTWFTAELVNYLAILPVILTLPSSVSFRLRARRASDTLQAMSTRLLPLVSVLFGCVLGVVFNGPGDIAYPLPGLLWCAVSYGLFTTALITLLTCAWILIASSLGYIQGNADLSLPYALESLRLGSALIALAPLSVACVVRSLQRTLETLKYTANHDYLTDTLNRGGFMQGASVLLQQCQARAEPVAVLMLDIDHFKQINDRHGHATGDQVLAAFAGTLKASLRKEDLIGRVGGEEFAVIVPGCTYDSALRIAESICRHCAATEIPLPAGKQLQVTTSLGLSHSIDCHASLEELLQAADQQLYLAKQSGRNRALAVSL